MPGTANELIQPGAVLGWATLVGRTCSGPCVDGAGTPLSFGGYTPEARGRRGAITAKNPFSSCIKMAVEID